MSYYTKEVRNEHREKIRKLAHELIPFEITRLKVSEFASENRIMQTGPRPGLYDPYYTPYLVEIVDELSVFTSTQRCIFCKSAQVGATTAAENLICYYMKEHPTDQMYISGNEKLLKTWSENKLDPAIIAFGIDKYIRSSIDKKHHKKTGDTVFKKQYFGNSLILSSARSASGLRMTDRQVLVRDEIDSAPRMLATGEGNWLEVSYARTNSWGSRRKIFDFSTPTIIDNPIWNEYLIGDCRKFYVACPICGVFQELEFGDEDTNYGLKGLIKDGKIIDAYYLCRECQGHIRDEHKGQILKTGYWKPTKEADLRYTKSYHINSLYSPPGMLSFYELVEKWESAKRDREKLISFHNLYMGLPWEDSADQPNVYEIISNKDDYKSWTVPDNVLFITIGADVQEGSKVDVKNPPRIELEVCGHGRGYRTWSIGYKVFEGKTTLPFIGAWKKLEEWINETKLTFLREDGIPIQVSFGLIDSGHGGFVDTVYSFCNQWNIIFPSKGSRELKRKPGEIERRDIRSSGDKIKYRSTRVNNDTILYNISTITYKDAVYSNIQIPRQDGDIQRPGFCSFPKDYPRLYFEQLTSEKKQIDMNGSTYYKESRSLRNEPLDCRVLNLAAHDIFLDIQVDNQRKFLKSRGNKDEVLEQVRSNTILTMIENNIRSAIRSKIAS